MSESRKSLCSCETRGCRRRLFHARFDQVKRASALAALMAQEHVAETWAKLHWFTSHELLAVVANLVRVCAT